MVLIKRVKEIKEKIEEGEEEEAREMIEKFKTVLSEVEAKTDDDGIQFNSLKTDLTILQTSILGDREGAIEQADRIINRLRKVKNMESSSEFQVDYTLGADSDKETIEAEDLDNGVGERDFLEDEIERVQDQLQHLENRVNELEDSK